MRVLKRALDLGLTLLAAPLVLPLGLLVALAIRLDSPGPALFVQQRAGRDHRPFAIYKFRSMRTDTPSVSTEELQRLGIRPVTRWGNLSAAPAWMSCRNSGTSCGAT
ncbi:sugar transferase [Deinococcus multiflagellatus]|uniref:Sugar transferase n=1 Tax=Deinococcus multiflagellatus TaxID=1656887 RepID=A0ABW1ZL73_9DEIO